MDFEGIKSKLPWWLKMGTKLAIFFIPNKNVLFRSLGLYKHGMMIDSQYALSVFKSHLKRSGFSIKNKTILEIGPGDSVSTGIIAWAMGAKKTYLVDNGGFATREVKVYKHLANELSAQGLDKAEQVLKCNNFDDIMDVTSTVYLTEGLDSIKKIKSNHIDFCFSHAVIEHVLLNEIEDFLSELYRVHDIGGIGSHQIDLKDHMGGGLNSLRFGASLWESSLFKKAGFYTNRLRSSQLIEIILKAGFNIVEVQDKRWDRLPINRDKMSGAFRTMPYEELLIQDIYVLFNK